MNGATDYHMDIIFLRELKVETLIGIYEWENARRKPCKSTSTSPSPTARLPDRQHRRRAGLLESRRQHIQTVLSEGHFSLLETLAEHIAQIILKDFNAPWVKVSVAKLQAIRNCRMVGVLY